MPAKPLPRPEEFAPGEILVEVYDPRADSMNRVRFCAFWPDPTPPGEGGPPAGVRAQVFHCELAGFIARSERDGHTVRTWTPPADLG